jgi:hypothetical protein
MRGLSFFIDCHVESLSALLGKMRSNLVEDLEECDNWWAAYLVGSCERSLRQVMLTFTYPGSLWCVDSLEIKLNMNSLLIRCLL